MADKESLSLSEDFLEPIHLHQVFRNDRPREMLGVIGDDMEAELVGATMDVPLFVAWRDSLINADVRMDSFYFLSRRLLLHLIGMKYMSVSTKTSVLRKMSILILWFTSSVSRLLSMAYLQTTSLHQQKDRKLVSLGDFPSFTYRYYSEHRKESIQNTEFLSETPRKNRLRLQEKID